MKKTTVALLSIALCLSAAADVHLLPAGEFVGRDGRPGKGLTWKLSDAQGRVLAQRLTERHARVNFNLDYEHQAMLAETNGQPAPASGWATTFEWRDGDGLYALAVKWTARARQMIEDEEYKYISPVIAFDSKTGEVQDVLNASLVNIPNLDLNSVAQNSVARLNANFSTTDPEQPQMNELLKALGLAEGATEAQALTAVAALKATAASVSGLTTEIANLKAAPPDASKFVSVDKIAELNTEIATLKSADVKRQVEDLITQAKAAGKVVPAVEPIWRDIGMADIAKLKSMVDATPGNAALAGNSQTGGKPPGKPEDGALNEAELAICKNMGLTPEQFKAGQTAEA